MSHIINEMVDTIPEYNSEKTVLEINLDFKRYVNKFMSISDHKLRKEQLQFMLMSHTYGSLMSVVITLLYYFSALFFACTGSLSHKHEEYTMKWYLSLLSYIILLAATPMAFILPFTRNNKWNIICKQYMYILASLLMGIVFFSRVHDGPCLTNNYNGHNITNIFKVLQCNPHATSYSLPHDLTLLLMSFPIAVSSIKAEIHIEVLVSSWFIVIVSMLISIYCANLWNSLSTVAMYAPISLVIIIEQQRQQVYTVLYCIYCTILYNDTCYTHKSIVISRLSYYHIIILI